MLTGAHESRFPERKSALSRYSHESMIEELISLVNNKKMNVLPMITHIVHPGQFKEAYEGLIHKQDTYLGVIIEW